MGIADDGTIVGTAVRHGQTHAYAMFLSAVPEAGTAFLMAVGLMAIAVPKVLPRSGSRSA